MRHPSKQLIIVSLSSLIVGYAVSWAIMFFALKTTYRLYGFIYLSSVAVLVAILMVIFLDSPLNLRVFDWPKADEQAKKEPGYYKFSTEWLITVDHKRIGIMYFVLGFIFLIIGSIFALYIRIQLTAPGLEFLTPEQYNVYSTLYGPLIFLGIMPILTAFANYFVPLQVGARSMAFPRLNALAFWMFIFSSLLVYSSFLFAGSTFTPVEESENLIIYTFLPAYEFLPGLDMRLWLAGAFGVGISLVLGAISLLTTIGSKRAPGMGIHKLPLFSWMVLLQSTLYALLALIATSIITGALTAVITQNRLQMEIELFSASDASILWQHLYWAYAYPVACIMLLSAIGIVSDILPVFARKALAGYKTIIYTAALISAVGSIIWGYHLYIGGIHLSSQSFYITISLAVIAPMALILLRWIQTLKNSSIAFKSPFLFAAAFMIIFIIGGIGNIIATAIPPCSKLFYNDYTVTAYLHYVAFGGTVMTIFAAIYYWFPKVTGRMLSDYLGQIQCGLMLVGFTVMFFPMYFLGLVEMPPHTVQYEASSGWTGYNMVLTIGAFIVATSLVPFFWNVITALSKGAEATYDPWAANSLEWVTSSPPPKYNYLKIPTVSNEQSHSGPEAAVSPSAPEPASTSG